MKALWPRYAERFDALTLRERAMVFAAAVVVLVAVVQTALIDVQTARQKRLSAAIAEKQSQIRRFEAQITTLARASAAHPDRTGRERLEGLRASLAEVQAGIAGEQHRFTPPGEMRSVLSEMLSRTRGVRLVGMKTLAAAPLSHSGPGRLIFRHGLELTVSGGYLDLLRYVAGLERLPTRIYWGGLQIDATAYPKVRMRLTVYTLSLDREWLNV